MEAGDITLFLLTIFIRIALFNYYYVFHDIKEFVMLQVIFFYCRLKMTYKK